jgi:hypothetical protein
MHILPTPARWLAVRKIGIHTCANSDIPYLDRRSLSTPAARTARSRSPRRRNLYPGRTSGRKPAGRARRRIEEEYSRIFVG